MCHLSNWSAFTILLSVVAAAAYTPSYPSFTSFHHQAPSARTRSVFSHFRDGLIRSIWSIPSCARERIATNEAKSESTPPSTMLARYGGDIVLRFTITSPEEAAALSEAVHILFLDVWEFNADWVDIRLAKDLVRLHPILAPPTDGLCRSRYPDLPNPKRGPYRCLSSLLIDLLIGPIVTWTATSILTACPYPLDARPGPSHLRVVSFLDL